MQKRNSSVSKSFNVTRSAVAAASAALLLSTLHASAALTYDADTTAPANDGTGVWNTSTANWFDGTNDVLWPNTTADVATFGVGGTGGTVTVGTVNVGTITFNPTVTTAYTLNGGTITLGSGITSTTTVGTVNIGSVIAGSAGLAFSGTGTATVSLNGANTYSGITTTGTLGRLQANNALALGASAGATATTLGTDYTSVATNGTLVATSNTTEAFVINGSGQGSAGAIRINNSPTFGSLIQLGSNAFILNNGGGSPTVNGNIDLGTFGLNTNNFGAAPVVTAGIIQPSLSNWTINGDITGAGTVQIQSSGGVMLFNNAKSYTGATTVLAGATLGGTASLASSTVNVAGTVTGANYNSVGTLTFNKALSITGSDAADLTATGSDTLAVGTTLTLGAASILKLQGTTGAASYTLATYGTLTGTFGSVLFNGVAGVPAGYVLSYGTGTNSAITLTNPSLLPEPATLGAIGAGAVTLLRRRRRA